MRPLEWPPLVERIVPQTTVAITFAAERGGCLLRGLAPFDPSDKWSGTPHSVIGNAVHAMLHRYASYDEKERKDILSTRATLEAVFKKVVFDKSEVADEAGFEKWFIGIPSEFWEGALQTLSSGIDQMSKAFPKRQWARKERSSPEQSSDFARAFDRIDFMKPGVWPEIPILSNDLGIKGRCDLIVSSGDGNIRVDDYKAGSLNGDTEKIIRYGRQVLLYLAALRLKHPEAFLSGRLIAADGIYNVPVSHKELDSIIDELRAEKASWPTGLTDGVLLAQVGEKCPSCRLRHRCPSYRATEPWVENPNSPIPTDSWTKDVWGLVVKAHKGPLHDSVALRTRSGARIIINRLDPARSLGELKVGQEVGFFGLIKGKSWKPENQEFVEYHTDGRRAWSLKVFKSEPSQS